MNIAELKELIKDAPDNLMVFVPFEEGFITASVENSGITELGEPCDEQGNSVDEPTVLTTVFTISN